MNRHSVRYYWRRVVSHGRVRACASFNSVKPCTLYCNLVVVMMMQTARRVLTVLESGEYFGESGVLTYFKGGSKASAAPPPVTERFSIVARTNVELLVLRRKHFNIIEMPVSVWCVVQSATRT